MCLADPQHKKSKESVQKYVATISSLGSKPWQELMCKHLVAPIEAMLGIAKVAPVEAQKEEKKGDKKEKKD